MTTSHTPGPWAVTETLTGALSINKADKASPYYGGFWNGVRGRLCNTQDWRGTDNA